LPGKKQDSAKTLLLASSIAAFVLNTYANSITGAYHPHYYISFIPILTIPSFLFWDSLYRVGTTGYHQAGGVVGNATGSLKGTGGMGNNAGAAARAGGLLQRHLLQRFACCFHCRISRVIIKLSCQAS
jgi:hypothetical protein